MEIALKIKALDIIKTLFQMLLGLHMPLKEIQTHTDWNVKI